MTSVSPKYQSQMRGLMVLAKIGDSARDTINKQQSEILEITWLLHSFVYIEI